MSPAMAALSDDSLHVVRLETLLLPPTCTLKVLQPDVVTCHAYA